MNKEVVVRGAAIMHHGAFYSQKEKDEKGQPLLKAGYDYISFLTDMEDEAGLPKLLDAAYGSLANHTRGMLHKRGWFIWEKPVKYLLSIDPDTNAFRMIDVERVKSMFPKKTGNK